MPHAKHKPGSSCQSCEEKLDLVCDYMQRWFYRRKQSHPELHIAWGFRNQQQQEECFARKATTTHWPNSKHNHVSIIGEPDSRALDLFSLNVMGNAVFPDSLYKSLWDESVAEKAEIKWGHNFKHNSGDGDHFEWDIPVPILPV